jgi:hypothetical protein
MWMYVYRYFDIDVSPYVLVEWLALLLRIMEVQRSNLGPDTGYLTEDFCGFPQSLHANSGIVP